MLPNNSVWVFPTTPAQSPTFSGPVAYSTISVMVSFTLSTTIYMSCSVTLLTTVVTTLKVCSAAPALFRTLWFNDPPSSLCSETHTLLQEIIKFRKNIYITITTLISLNIQSKMFNLIFLQNCKQKNFLLFLHNGDYNNFIILLLVWVTLNKENKRCNCKTYLLPYYKLHFFPI